MASFASHSIILDAYFQHPYTGVCRHVLDIHGLELEFFMKKGPSKIVILILLAAAIGVCIYGAATGQAQSVFVKATKICMECIGLG